MEVDAASSKEDDKAQNLSEERNESPRSVEATPISPTASVSFSNEVTLDVQVGDNPARNPDTSIPSSNDSDDVTAKNCQPTETLASEHNPSHKQNGNSFHEAEEKKEEASVSSPAEPDSSMQPFLQLPFVASFSDGLQRKHHISDLQAWAKLALTLDGRDKITKVLQYSSRFLAWWFLGTKQANRFETLKKSLSNSRKAFRLGRTMIELQRLSKMGLDETISWHLRQSDNNSDPALSKPNPKTLIPRVSTNIGLGYPNSTNQEAIQEILQQERPSLLRRLSHLTSRIFELPRESAIEKPLYHVLLSATKLMGLACYFAADNVSYLASTGLLDNYMLQDSERVSQRKRVVKFVSENGNRAYFIAALAGLVVSWRNYRDFTRTTNEHYLQEEGESVDDAELSKAKEKHFSLLLPLLKSCCDVLVFTNNPGVDLWRTVAGRPLNEAVHCAAGLISASTVLCTNFPSHSPK